MAFQKEDVRGGKLPKDRITVLVGSSAVGEKLPLLVIGRSKNPRCFPRDHDLLPVRYVNNSKAWMTGGVFEEWLRNLNHVMEEKNRTIGLVLDNCPAHPQITDLSNAKLVFLPPNTTSKTQPMDAGIIRSLKHQYRKRLARKRLFAFDTGREFNFNLLNPFMDGSFSEWFACAESAPHLPSYLTAGAEQ